MLRSLLAITLFGAALPAFADAPPTNVPVQLAMFDGPLAGSCLHVPEPPDYGFKVLQAQCLTVGDAQMWQFESAVQGGYIVRNMKSEHCLDAEAGSAPGTVVNAFTCNGAQTQRWDVNFSEGNPGTAMIRSQQTGLCLDFYAGTASQATCSFTTGQAPTWMASRQGARAPSGAFALRSVIDGACMSLGEFPVSVACENDRRSSLRFVPIDASATTFRFDGPVEGTCLIDGGVDNAVVYANCLTGTDGHWRILETGASAQVPNASGRQMRWQVQNVGTGQCLHAKRGSFVPEGETVTAWACDASDNALWEFVKY
ncbi:RICIN domain-containing protein [Noviluteimonas gilva]|uniref:Ricin B lectin domain-containing protein n=1 Tax=Noviluteimonas gilva TaxID=2682097 RepID=A0A7C9HY41_9GAMM|nr:RICIN domain-containing protein [Lysobacter gilvus]MUV13774.1 hypothetical protein [Lysobacter gilvus]